MRMRTTPGYLPAISAASLANFGLGGILIGQGRIVLGVAFIIANAVGTVLAYIYRPRVSVQLK